MLGRAGEEGQRKRLEAAKKGEITWLPPPGLGAPATEEDAKKGAKGAAAKAKKLLIDEDETVQTKGTRSQAGSINVNNL